MKENLSPMALKDAMPREDALDLRGRGWSYKDIYDLKIKNATRKQAELEQLGLGTEADWQNAIERQRQAVKQPEPKNANNIISGDIFELKKPIPYTSSSNGSLGERESAGILASSGTEVVVTFRNEPRIGLASLDGSLINSKAVDEQPRRSLTADRDVMEFYLGNPRFATRIGAFISESELRLPKELQPRLQLGNPPEMVSGMLPKPTFTPQGDIAPQDTGVRAAGD